MILICQTFAIGEEFVTVMLIPRIYIVCSSREMVLSKFYYGLRDKNNTRDKCRIKFINILGINSSATKIG